ncbi:Protein BTR1 [Senna tora]|uniref:Protein BTR1 n=1 Tax=Senna tora TaxID=362788 RepID=A0A834SWS7_9FABA|nr:Protein BTR1 [Senna tora]
MIVEPPFPMTEPAAAFDTRNLTYVDLSIESGRSKHNARVRNHELTQRKQIGSDTLRRGIGSRRNWFPEPGSLWRRHIGRFRRLHYPSISLSFGLKAIHRYIGERKQQFKTIRTNSNILEKNPESTKSEGREIEYRNG